MCDVSFLCYSEMLERANLFAGHSMARWHTWQSRKIMPDQQINLSFTNTLSSYIYILAQLSTLSIFKLFSHLHNIFPFYGHNIFANKIIFLYAYLKWNNVRHSSRPLYPCIFSFSHCSFAWKANICHINGNYAFGILHMGKIKERKNFYVHICSVNNKQK